MCQEKKKPTKTADVVVRHILSHEFYSRGQVEFIDMQPLSLVEHGGLWFTSATSQTFVIIKPLFYKSANTL